jgi:hypothetical protein
LIVVFSFVGLALAVIIILLVTGGPPGDGGFNPRDPSSDVVVEGERNPPPDLSLADIARADVRPDGDGIIFEATMATAIPDQLKEGGLEWRWEVIEGGTPTWIVSANLDLGPNATVLSQRTDYGASTIDGLLPGTVVVEGSTITIRIERPAIASFPSSFNWTLTTSLDADRTEARSALAKDSAPDGGPGEFPPP